MGIELQSQPDSPAQDQSENHSIWQKGLFYLEQKALAPKQPEASRNNQAPGQYKSIELEVEGQKREYEVYQSTKFDPNKPARVIFGMHGSFFGKDGARGLMARETGLDEAIENRKDADNALVVYPLAANRTATMITGQSWNYRDHKNMFDTWTNYDDGKYMDAVLDDLKKQVKIDKLDGVGFGDGGRFLKAYSDDHPGLFEKLVLQNSTTLGDPPKTPVEGAKTDYLIMHSVRDPDKSSWAETLKHPLTTNMAVPYDGGHGFLSFWTPNLSGMPDSRPDQLKVEAARANRCDNNPQIIDTPEERITNYRNCKGGAVVERLEKGTQMAWNDIKYGDGGHGIFALVGSRSNFADTTVSLDFLLRKQGQTVPKF